jgi:multiple sugar transport system permease protein
MWRFMYNPMIGVYTWLLGLAGIGPIDFLGSPSIAFFAVLLVDVWQWCYFIGVLLLASIQLLPPEPAEAAKIDGATKLQLFRHVTLPLIWPTLAFIIFLRWIESMRSFDLIYNMTKGGPGTTTEILDLYAYRIGIGSGGNISYAAAMSLVMLALTIVITNVARNRWFPE